MTTVLMSTSKSSNVFLKIGSILVQRLSRSAAIESSLEASDLSVANPLPRDDKNDNQWDDHIKTQDGLVEYLVGNVIYDNDNVVAVNKPPGIPYKSPMYDDNSNDHAPIGADISITGVLEQLARALQVPKLIDVYNQPRLYSGITLFAKNKPSQALLEEYFFKVRKQKMFYQKYLAVTTSIPKVTTGEQILGLQRASIGKSLLSVFAAEKSRRACRMRKENHIHIKHKTLITNQTTQTALLELDPIATKWDCLQMYLLYHMSPALGDHLYSSRLSKIASQPVLMDPFTSYPRKQHLSLNIQKSLGLPQDYQFEIPLHIHCSQLKIPKLKERQDGKLKTMSKTATLYAEPPACFMHTLSRLKLFLPQISKGGHVKKNCILLDRPYNLTEADYQT